LNLRMRGQEVFDLLTLVRREIVRDHMDLLAAWLVDHDVGEECDELRGSVPLCSFAQHLAGLGVEGGVQRERAVTEVLKAVPLGPARGERQDGIFAIQGLNMRARSKTKCNILWEILLHGKTLYAVEY